MALLDVHMLDRFVPELERYLLVDDIGIYLISEGLLSVEEYQAIVKYTSRREAIVELLHRVKRKGPNAFHIFLQALQRSISESSAPHQGHVELWELLQARVSVQGEQLLKRKSKSVSSLLGRFTKRRSRNSKDAILHSPLSISTPATMTSINSHASTISTATCFSSDEERYVSDSSASSTYNQSPPDLGSFQDSYNLEAPVDRPSTEDKIEQLSCDLKSKSNEVEKQKAIIKEQLLYIEELKSQKDMNKKKNQALKIKNMELQLETSDQITKYESKIAELTDQIRFLQLKVQKVTKEKDSLKRIAEESPTLMLPTREPSSSSRSHRFHSLSTINSFSLTSINEMEELKSEMSKKDAVIHSKLDQIAQMCQNLQEPQLKRRWHSDMRLVHHNNDSSFAHSQT